MSPSPPVRSSPQIKQHQANNLNPNNLSNSQINAIIQATIQNSGIPSSSFNNPTSYAAAAAAAAESSEFLSYFNAHNQKDLNNHGLSSIGNFLV